MLARETVRGLVKIVGHRNCRTDPEDLICYGYDATDLRYTPDAVVFPADAEELVAIVRLANEPAYN